MCLSASAKIRFLHCVSKTTLLATDVIGCHVKHRACQPACAAGERAFIAEQYLRSADVPAVHTETLAGRGETCGWASAAAGASGDRVLG